MRFASGILAACICLSGFGFAARANWTANVSGPDVFGNTTVLAMVEGRRDALAIQCNQKDQLILAYIFQIKQFENVTSAPAELLIQINGGSPRTFSATLGQWNDSFGSVSMTGRQPDVAEVVRALGAAKGVVNVGIVVRGQQDSASFDSIGSADAINKVVKNCQIDKILDGKSSPQTN